jgi:predicted nucleic acid-binding protein
MRLYLDSCVVIYYVEQNPLFFLRVDERINDAETRIVVSDLTRLECLVQPLRQSDTDRLKQFELFFRSSDLVVMGCSGSVFDLATELRARHRLKTPDALHLAAAIHGGCEEFWTNDHRLDIAAGDHLKTITL